MCCDNMRKLDRSYRPDTSVLYVGGADVGRGQSQWTQANVLTLVSNVSPGSKMVNCQKVQLDHVSCPTGPTYLYVPPVCGDGSTSWTKSPAHTVTQPYIQPHLVQDHGGTGPGEHQPAGPVCVPRWPSTARVFWSHLYFIEVRPRSRIVELSMGFPEGWRSEHCHHSGDGESSCDVTHLSPSVHGPEVHSTVYNSMYTFFLFPENRFVYLKYMFKG